MLNKVKIINNKVIQVKKIYVKITQPFIFSI